MYLLDIWLFLHAGLKFISESLIFQKFMSDHCQVKMAFLRLVSNVKKHVFKQDVY